MYVWRPNFLRPTFRAPFHIQAAIIEGETH